MEIVAGIIELKPNSLERVEEWAKTINKRIDEAVATLRNEGKDYLLSYTICSLNIRVDSLKQAQDEVKHSKYAIDVYHQKFKKETWAGGTRARFLIDLVEDAT